MAKIDYYPQVDSAPSEAEQATGTNVGVKRCLDTYVRNPSSDPVQVFQTGAIVAAGTPIIRNISVGTVETTLTFTSGTKRFSFKLRDNADLFVGTSVGSTTAGPFFTLFTGQSYEEDGLNVSSVTLYIKASKFGQTLEIWEWT